MSAREAIIQELKLAPESLVREAYDYVLFLKSKRRETIASTDAPLAATLPDFAARQRKLFGTREVSDSQPLLDELRAERL